MVQRWGMRVITWVITKWGYVVETIFTWWANEGIGTLLCCCPSHGTHQSTHTRRSPRPSPPRRRDRDPERGARRAGLDTTAPFQRRSRHRHARRSSLLHCYLLQRHARDGRPRVQHGPRGPLFPPRRAPRRQGRRRGDPPGGEDSVREKDCGCSVCCLCAVCCCAVCWCCIDYSAVCSSAESGKKQCLTHDRPPPSSRLSVSPSLRLSVSPVSPSLPPPF